jgi:phospholipid transport system substrate-binding protein
MERATMIIHLIRVLALVLTLNLAVAVSGATADTPTDAVKGVIDEVLKILSNPALKSPSQKEHRIQLIKDTINRRFDYEEMAKRSLGQYWRSLSPAQRTEFVHLFKDLLADSYSDKFDKYTDEKVAYTEGSQEGDYAEVRTQLRRKNDRIPINFRLLNKDTGWMVYDVSIEGVSLVSNYRSQFGRIIHESSYAELLRRLRAKASELQKIEKM